MLHTVGNLFSSLPLLTVLSSLSPLVATVESLPVLIYVYYALMYLRKCCDSERNNLDILTDLAVSTSPEYEK
jgi:hypothetical protein